MSIFSTFRAIVFIIVGLFFLVSFSVYKMNVLEKAHYHALAYQAELQELGEQLAQGSDYLTDEIRRYVQFGERVHYDNFWNEVHVTRSRDKAVERLKELEVLPSELAYIEKAKGYSDHLIKTEEEAMAAVERKDFDEARRLAFGEYYGEQKNLIMGNIKKFQDTVNARAQALTEHFHDKLSFFMMLTNLLLLVSGVLVLFLVYSIGIRRLLNPLKYLTHIMQELVQGNLEIPIQVSGKRDEMAEMGRALQVFKENAIKKNIAELERHKAEMDLEKHLEDLEKLVQERTSALEKSNQNLSDFASIASHDLQEPLRKVNMFGDMLKELNQDLDEKSCDYINRMQSATFRMQSLINDLLEFSKLTTENSPFVKIDFNKIIEGTLSDLETRINESQGTINVDTLPGIEADPFQMHQLFQNLVSNALKYRKEDVDPVINISAQSDGNSHVIIKIEDNGIGFDEKYKDKIFHLFQRLHGKNEYGGTGMGLAICKKIVEHHNGSITVNSTPGAGTTFQVSLPKKQPPLSRETFA